MAPFWGKKKHYFFLVFLMILLPYESGGTCTHSRPSPENSPSFCVTGSWAGESRTIWWGCVLEASPASVSLWPITPTLNSVTLSHATQWTTAYISVLTEAVVDATVTVIEAWFWSKFWSRMLQKMGGWTLTSYSGDGIAETVKRFIINCQQKVFSHFRRWDHSDTL